MTDYKWWQTGIIYQIYPRSFQDSNSDGIGDIPGIISRLDYLKEIGIDAVWISPFYPSPMHDFGYDVSDYEGIHPIFGTMKDFDRLLDEIHKREMKLLIDLVPNHTSDEHPWFVESRKSKDNPYRDFYYWRDPKPNGDVPNNWLSFFGGSSWEFDAKTGQYYLHQFLKQQPELNYQNPKVLKAMLDIMEFWLKKGVDGFRVDVICNMWKEPGLPDNPLNPDWNGKIYYEKFIHPYSSNLPGVHPLIKEMRKVVDKYSDRVMIGETYLAYKDLIKYYGDNDECHIPFNFHLINIPWKASVIKKKVNEYVKILPEGCWPSFVLGNHDQKRIATRAGEKQTRVAEMLLLTLKGTPTVYYGEEIGMENVTIPKHMIKDPPALNQPEIADLVGRDPERTPMQWDDSANAGFTGAGVETWLPIAKDYQQINVKNQEKDKGSTLSFFKALTKLRADNDCLKIGNYKYIPVQYRDIFAYTRSYGNELILIVLNMSDKSFNLDLSKKFKGMKASQLLATDLKPRKSLYIENLKIDPNLGLILKLKLNNNE